MDISEPKSRTGVADWLSAVKQANASGDYLQAIDAAQQGLLQHPQSLELGYSELLAYARAGAGRRAEVELNRLEAEGRLASLTDARLKTDFVALRGRILKDRAMRAEKPDARAAWATEAAKAYERAFMLSGGGFPAVNAATLWRVAGDEARSVLFARTAIGQSKTQSDDYWRFATEGEALCLLGDEGGATRALAAAFAAASGRGDVIAATRRQLAWLSRVAGIGAAALTALPAPRVLHWLARRSGDAGAQASPLGEDRGGLVAFGSLLSEADFAVIDVLAGAGAEINLTLPCAPEVCRARLVSERGEGLGEGFDRRLRLAANVMIVTPEGDPAEPTLVRLAVEEARGEALIRAAALSTSVAMLHVEGAQWNIAQPSAAGEDPLVFVDRPSPRGGAGGLWPRRVARALVFGDVKGFSALAEAAHPAFFDVVLGGFAEAIESFGAHVEYAETAGDGLYLVATDVLTAMALCHALHASLAPERLARAGLPALVLRLSAHYGPVFPGRDPVTRREKFFGKEVVRTARIEPVTPPGETYVTEQFAATAAAEAPGAFACDYVGRQPMAKGFGACRMYALRSPIYA